MVSAMLSETLFRVPRADGLRLLRQQGGHGTRLTTWRLRLDAGRSHRYTSDDEEAIFVLQQGNGAIEIDGTMERVAVKRLRRPRNGCVCAAGSHADDRCGCAARRRAHLHRHRRRCSTIATPTDVVVNPRGRGNYTREVHDIFVRDPHVRRLMVGETFNPPGNWSSYPPHKHDGRNGEPALEEVYYFRIDHRRDSAIRCSIRATANR